ncbi:discoidin domain-containing protein [Streptococcus sp. E17BB]|uniref:discoidin domain-containing protein n=1 Tax=Streptococcus sp. E17BB TaxID=3278714 RepID=UPI00359E95AE
MKAKHRLFDERQRYGIRKLAVGTGSILIGSFLLGVNTAFAQEQATSETTTNLGAVAVDEYNQLAEPSLSTSTRLANLEEGEPLVEDLIHHKQGQVMSSGVDLNDLERFSHDYAFDHNPETRYAAPKMKEQGSSATDPQTPQWVQIDLGQKAKLISGRVDFYRLVYSTDYEVLTASQSDAQEADWRQVVHRTALADYGPADQSDYFTLETPQDLDRHVRIRFNRVNAGASGYAVSVKDIRLNGYLLANSTTEPEKPATAIALNRPVTASGVEAGTDTSPEQAFDGDASTRWAGLPMKKSNRPDDMQTPQWLQLDLGSDGKLAAIEIDFFRKVYATDYSLLTSATGQEGSFRELHRSTNLAASATAADLTDRLVFEQPLAVNRYLRFQFNRINHHAGGNSVSVKDIRVNGWLAEDAKEPVDPVTKLEAAHLIVRDGRVVLVGADTDDEYIYEVIGSANQYVVDNQGRLATYRLNDMDVVMVVAARHQTTGELVIPSKMNKTIHIPASHQETVTGTNAKPLLALDIQEFLPGEGILTLDEQSTLYVADGLAKQAALFNKDLQTILGYQLSSAPADQATISFTLTDEYDLKDEGYLMRIGDKVDVFAKDAKAFNYAAVTLAQMLQAQGHLTKGVYRDYPNYAIRGMLLDVARIPMRQDFLEEVSHLFRWYKLNELHLHINDNQWPDGSRSSAEAWAKTEAAHRLESTAFPSLNKSAFKHDRYEGEYDFYRDTYGNPAYSLEEFKKFQAQNGVAGINTLVEFDTPGHSAVYSLYALNNPDQIDYLGQPIHHPNDLEALAINEQVYPEETARAKRFVRELLNSYLDAGIFTYDHIHLGVDEYWQKNGNKEAFRTYLNELNELAREHGKTLRTWGALSIFQGNTPVSKDIIFDEWAQYESVSVDRINEGFRVVNVPQPFTYVTPGRNHKDIINEQYVFDHWKPYVFNLDVASHQRQALEGEPLLLGAKGAMWGDEHAEGIEESDLYYRLEKSLAMIGFKTWNGKSPRSFLEYQKALEATRLRNNYLPYQTKTEVLLNIGATYAQDNQVSDLSTNGLGIRSEGRTAIVELDGEKWLKFDGDNHLVTDVQTLGLPYTLEMTFKPTNVDKGSLLLSEDGALFLNAKGRTQAGEVAEGFNLNRYFYSQHIAPKLESGKVYKLTLTGTREVLNVYLNDEQIASFSHTEGLPLGTRGNFRTSFNLPIKEIGKGFEGYIKTITVYNRTQEATEVGNEHLERVNVALHKPVYDYRHQSAFWNQHIKPYHRGRLTDGDTDGPEGRWQSSNHDHDYFIVDLGEQTDFDTVQVVFDASRAATAFNIAVSDDMTNFRDVKQVTQNTTTMVTLDLGPQKARYVKFASVTRKPGTNEVGIKEFRVYQPRTVDKSALAQLLATKEITIENDTWLYATNVLANKFATVQDVSDALALVEKLKDRTAEDDDSTVAPETPEDAGKQDETPAPDSSDGADTPDVSAPTSPEDSSDSGAGSDSASESADTPANSVDNGSGSEDAGKQTETPAPDSPDMSAPTSPEDSSESGTDSGSAGEQDEASAPDSSDGADTPDMSAPTSPEDSSESGTDSGSAGESTNAPADSVDNGSDLEGAGEQAETPALDTPDISAPISPEDSEASGAGLDSAGESTNAPADSVDDGSDLDGSSEHAETPTPDSSDGAALLNVGIAQRLMNADRTRPSEHNLTSSLSLSGEFATRSDENSQISAAFPQSRNAETAQAITQNHQASERAKNPITTEPKKMKSANSSPKASATQAETSDFPALLVLGAGGMLAALGLLSVRRRGTK